MEEQQDGSDPGIRRICDLLQSRIGVHLEQEKEYLVRLRLASRLAVRRVESFSEYAALLENEESEEWDHVIHSLTNHTTKFFREKAQFDFLERLVFRDLHQRTSPLKVWSAAASTGEEPYSIAILADMTGLLDQIEVLATDVDRFSLEFAKKGRYGKDKLAGLEGILRQRYFRLVSENHSGDVDFDERLKERVTFKWLNLNDKVYSVGIDFDVIFCRNVLVYFSPECRLSVIGKLFNRLSPGGLLFLGHAESVPPGRFSLKMVAPSIYKKI